MKRASSSSPRPWRERPLWRISRSGLDGGAKAASGSHGPPAAGAFDRRLQPVQRRIDAHRAVAEERVRRRSTCAVASAAARDASRPIAFSMVEQRLHFTLDFRRQPRDAPCRHTRHNRHADLREARRLSVASAMTPRKMSDTSGHALSRARACWYASRPRSIAVAQCFASLVERVPRPWRPRPRRGPAPSLARSPEGSRARLASRVRRIQQRHRRAADRAQQERQEECFPLRAISLDIAASKALSRAVRKR